MSVGFKQCVLDRRPMVSMGLISVPDAARQLGVSRARVQQRIQNGSLPAQRVGRQWVIDEEDLRSIRHHAGPGRPLSPASAWALIDLAAGDASRLSPSGRSRARTRLGKLLHEVQSMNDHDELGALMSRALGGRAERKLYRASPLDLPGLRADPRLYPSGLSAPESRISGEQWVEGYIRNTLHEDLVRDHVLSPAKAARADVVLHVVDSQDKLERVVASPLIVAADLAEHDGPRERARAQKLLGDLARRYNTGKNA